jgi:hypothetical protein
MNPLIADLHTLFTLTTLRFLDRLNSFDMSTSFILFHNSDILPQKGSTRNCSDRTRQKNFSRAKAQRRRESPGNAVALCAFAPLQATSFRKS